MNLSDAAELASGGAVWFGFAYLMLLAIISVVGTRSERTEERNWRDLFRQLERMSSACESAVDRLIELQSRQRNTD